MNVGTSRFLALAVLGLAGLAQASAQEPDPALHHIKEIHVGTMGQGDGAERYRVLLEKELRRVGFDVADKADDADAILTGTHSAEVHGDQASSRATVVLKTRSGKQIWFGDYVSQHRGEGPNETEKVTAGNCADGLRSDWEKAGKSGK